MFPTRETSIEQLPRDLGDVIVALRARIRQHVAEGISMCTASHDFTWQQGDEAFHCEVIARFGVVANAPEFATVSVRITTEGERRNLLEAPAFGPTAAMLLGLHGARHFRFDPDGWARVELPF